MKDMEAVGRYRAILHAIYALSPYEEDIYAALLSSDKPLHARELTQRVTMPRTKIYGTLNKLRFAGLVRLHEQGAEVPEKPPVWDYWPEKNRVRWLRENGVSWVQRFEADREAYARRLRDAVESMRFLEAALAEEEARAKKPV